MRILDKVTLRVIEEHLFNSEFDDQKDFQQRLGLERYEALMFELQEYAVLKNNLNVFMVYLSKAGYPVKSLNLELCLVSIVVRLADIFEAGFKTPFLERLSKENELFIQCVNDLRKDNSTDTKQDYLGGIKSLIRQSMTNQDELSDEELSQAFLLYNRAYWKRRFRSIDREKSAETPERVILQSYNQSIKWREMAEDKNTVVSYNTKPKKPVSISKWGLVVIVLTIAVVVGVLWWWLG